MGGARARACAEQCFLDGDPQAMSLKLVAAKWGATGGTILSAIDSKASWRVGLDTQKVSRCSAGIYFSKIADELACTFSLALPTPQYERTLLQAFALTSQTLPCSRQRRLAGRIVHGPCLELRNG